MPTETWTWNAAWIPFIAASFLLGSIPFGQIISRCVAQTDITRIGSRNIGATNVARVIGVKWGVLTLTLDVLKGLVPSLTFRLLYPHSPLGLSIVGLSALAGHQFTPFLRFKGGKGVATALGFFLAVSPTSAILALGVFLAVVYVWDFISLGSMASSFSVALFMALFGKSGTLVMSSVLAAGLICLKHRDNIQRIALGKERRWSRRKVEGRDAR